MVWWRPRPPTPPPAHPAGRAFPRHRCGCPHRQRSPRLVLRLFLFKRTQNCLTLFGPCAIVAVPSVPSCVVATALPANLQMKMSPEATHQSVHHCNQLEDPWAVGGPGYGLWCEVTEDFWEMPLDGCLRWVPSQVGIKKKHLESFGLFSATKQDECSIFFEQNTVQKSKHAVLRDQFHSNSNRCKPNNSKCNNSCRQAGFNLHHMRCAKANNGKTSFWRSCILRILCWSRAEQQSFFGDPDSLTSNPP